jgi:hypothetical protein
VIVSLIPSLGVGVSKLQWFGSALHDFVWAPKEVLESACASAPAATIRIAARGVQSVKQQQERTDKESRIS